jgi:peptidoglycan-N-acetylglucosamine deacetylase
VDRRALLRGAVWAAGGVGAAAVGQHVPGWVGPDRLPLGGGYAAADDQSSWVRSGQVTATWYVPTTEPAVALTFDDGPQPDWTPMVLDTLERAAAPATFFMVGQHLRDHRALVEGRLDAHEVGNHTWTHADLARLDKEQVRGQVRRTHDLVAEVTGREPVVLRPPWGHVGGSTMLAADELHYGLVLWSQQLEANDHPDQQVADVVRCAHPGAIILAHDVGAANRLPALCRLGDIIAGLRGRGFRLVTISELLALGPTPPRRS